MPTYLLTQRSGLLELIRAETVGDSSICKRCQFNSIHKSPRATWDEFESLCVIYF